MFLLDGMTLSPYLVTWAPQGGRILKVSLKMGSLGEFQRCSKLFGVFCPKTQDCGPGSRRAEPTCADAHLLPLTSPRPLPQQLGCVIETFQREICFSSLNFKQNFKCQVSKAKWGY